VGLEQVYYVGELIAATAVVASLLYIARQARQNTAMMQVNAAPIQTSILENVQRRLWTGFSRLHEPIPRV